MKPFDLKQFIMQGLRRFSYRYPARKEAIRNARVARGKYICVDCGPHTLHGPRDIQADHISPVISPSEGFVDWNTYIARLFPSIEGYQILCRKHHSIKTAKENSKRKYKYREYADGKDIKRKKRK